MINAWSVFRELTKVPTTARLQRLTFGLRSSLCLCVWIPPCCSIKCEQFLWLTTLWPHNILMIQRRMHTVIFCNVMVKRAKTLWAYGSAWRLRSIAGVQCVWRPFSRCTPKWAAGTVCATLLQQRRRRRISIGRRKRVFAWAQSACINERVPCTTRTFTSTRRLPRSHAHEIAPKYADQWVVKQCAYTIRMSSYSLDLPRFDLSVVWSDILG